MIVVNFNNRFFEACESGNKSELPLLLPMIEDINQKNEKGWSGIILAAFNGHIDIVRFLLDHGANVNDTNKNGTTVFMYAKDSVLKSKNYEILDLLLSRGAEINLKDKRGLTVLDYVKINKYYDLYDYMVSHGAK